ncbi:MAG TPA: GatB/YqeY domain-containing protein [Candidatus Paceibacterota bacterium]|nr:GatB/YqeY domain-containing protein [Candidatus Paceibacterota bacterium]
MQEKIRTELTAAMRAKDSAKVTTLRGVLAAFTNELVAKGKKPTDSLTDDEQVAVVKRLVKQRRDSIEQFEKGGRQDLADTEKAELAILEGYLPASMPREEIRKVASALKEKLGVTDKSKMGVFMGAVMKELKGAADGADVKVVVEELLS